MSRIAIIPLTEANQALAYVNEIIMDSATGHISTKLGNGKLVSATKEIQKRLEHSTDTLIFGNNDWTPLIYSITAGTAAYSASDKGVVVSGAGATLKIKARIPVDPESTYFIRGKVTKKSGNGGFFIGAESLDVNLAPLVTDGANSYNYFGASNKQIPASQSAYFEGTISGYNAPAENFPNKFDPEANYFDIAIVANYQSTDATTETVIEWIELHKAPNVMYVGQNKVFHEGFMGNGSGLDADTIRGKVGVAADGSVPMTGPLTLSGEPTGPQHAASKQYVDGVAQGLQIKASVRAASTGNVSLGATAGRTIDGVALATGDRVLLKDQTTKSQNGIYAVNADGSLTRTIDADVDSEVRSGMFCFVQEGDVNDNSGWTLITNNPIVVGTTGLDFQQFSGAGQITAGKGMTKSGNTLDVNGTAGRILANADSIDIDPNYVGQASINTLGDVTTGKWKATIVDILYGGTGSNNGSITGSGALVFAAGGSNKDITLTPSGTGKVILNGNVGVGNPSPTDNLVVGADVLAAGETRTIRLGDLLIQSIRDGQNKIVTTDTAGSAYGNLQIAAKGTLYFGSWGAEGQMTLSNGKLGIGIQNPGANLHIKTAGEASIFETDEDSDSKILLRTNGVDKGRISTNTDGVSIQAASSSWGRADLFVRNDGVVGIGTLAPYTVVAGASMFGGKTPKLGVLTGSAAGTYEEFMSIRHATNDATAVNRTLGLLFKMSNESSAAESDKMGGLVLSSSQGYAAAPALHLVTANRKRITVLADGKVGIGTQTPSEALEISGNIKLTGSLLSDQTSVAFKDSNGNPVPIQAAGIAATNDYSELPPPNGIYSKGSVGIGTNTPIAPLQVVGTDDLSLTSHGLGVFGQINTKNIAIDQDEIQARNNGAASSLGLNLEGGDVYIQASASGKVGIGTTAPTEKLEVGGNAKADQFISKAPQGTAPMVVNSTKKVDKLNADLLDDLDSTSFARVDAATTFAQPVTTNNTFNANQGISFGGGFVMKYNNVTGSLDIVAS